MRTAEQILDAVALAFGTPVPWMRSRWRDGETVRARWGAMKLLREERLLSTGIIGRLLDRDHTTVLHGLNRAREFEATDPDFAAALVKAGGSHG